MAVFEGSLRFPSERKCLRSMGSYWTRKREFERCREGADRKYTRGSSKNRGRCEIWIKDQFELIKILLFIALDFTE